MADSLPVAIHGTVVVFDDGFNLDVGPQAAPEIRVFIREQMNPATLRWIVKRRVAKERAEGVEKFGEQFYTAYEAGLEKAKTDG